MFVYYMVVYGVMCCCVEWILWNMTMGCIFLKISPSWFKKNLLIRGPPMFSLYEERINDFFGLIVSCC